MSRGFRFILPLVSAALLIALVATSFAALPVRPGGATVSRGDKAFMFDASRGNIAEITLGKLAAERSTNASVRNFGEHMIKDHTNIENDLQKLADGKNLSLPDTPDSKQIATVTRLQRLNGTAFDRAYKNEMVMDHEKDLAAYRKESRQADEADVRAYAARTAPIIEHHLNMARDMKV